MNRDRRIPFIHMGTVCVLIGYCLGNATIYPLIKYYDPLVTKLAYLLVVGHILTAVVVGAVVATFYKRKVRSSDKRLPQAYFPTNRDKVPKD